MSLVKDNVEEYHPPRRPSSGLSREKGYLIQSKVQELNDPCEDLDILICVHNDLIEWLYCSKKLNGVRPYLEELIVANAFGGAMIYTAVLDQNNLLLDDYKVFKKVLLLFEIIEVLYAADLNLVNKCLE